MRMIKREKFYGLVINIIFMILSVFLNLLEVDIEIWLKYTLTIYVVSLIVNLFLYKRINCRIFGVFSFFYIILGCLHLSQIFLGYSQEPSSVNIFFTSDIDVVKKSFEYSYLCISFMTLGYYVYTPRRISETTLNMPEKGEKEFIKILFYFLFSYRILLLIRGILIARTYGYSELLDTGSISGVILNFEKAISIIFLIYCCNSKKSLYSWTVIILLTELIYMMTGSRINGVIYMLVLLIFFPRENMKKNNVIKNFGIVLCLGFFISVIVGISNTRNSSSIISFGNLWNNIINENIFLGIVKEFGYTQIDIVRAIQYQNNLETLNGYSYYGSIVTLLPNINGILSSAIEKLYFITPIRKIVPYSYGGSCIAEAFMNFREWGIIFFLPIGMIISKIEYYVINLKYLKIWQSLGLILLVLSIFLWTRGYFFTMVRSAVWGIILYCCLKKVSVRR